MHVTNCWLINRCHKSITNKQIHIPVLSRVEDKVMNAGHNINRCSLQLKTDHLIELTILMDTHQKKICDTKIIRFQILTSIQLLKEIIFNTIRNETVEIELSKTLDVQIFKKVNKPGLKVKLQYNVICLSGYSKITFNSLKEESSKLFL
jgi:hypothetical protein